MKKILGLDLGSASIGWALVEETEQMQYNIVSLGSRIIPYNGTEGQEFEKGTGESRNSLRTKARTARKGYDRYQLRRKNLEKILLQNGMYPNEQVRALQKLELWKLRADAPNVQISLPELGRLLFWLNQKRGYKSSRSDANLDKKDTEYVATVKSRHQKIKDAGQTVGQYFYGQILENEYHRIKEQVFPREAYIEEFDAIVARQKEYYPTILKQELIDKIRNEVIYFQRGLKSQKGLVSVCEFEGREFNGHFGGPKVAPKSSPIFQLGKIWENINNIKIADIELTAEQKLVFFNYLNCHERITEAKIRELLKLSKDSRLNGQLKNGLTGNKTYSQIASCFGNKIGEYERLFKFELEVIESEKLEYTYHPKSHIPVGEKRRKYISENVEKEPYYRLWHTIYSIKDKDECRAALIKNFGIEEEIAEKLASLDFSAGGFGNKCAKVIRKILPYLMEGDKYNVAMDYAGYNHSFSQTKDENLQRVLLDSINHLPKNSLRQPIVEKILNQMINLVNEVIKQWGRPDEIRVELARKLKQSKTERNDDDNFMRKRERENEIIKADLAKYGLKATRNNVIKWRLYHEIDDKDKKLNARCIYCGQPISLTEAILGNNVDVEHIIPKDKLFDDSQSNKTLAHRSCNSGKGNKTAYDFMKDKPQFEEYVARVEELYKKHLISLTKKRKFLMSEDKIPSDFIDRQLRESQYIARKSREILQTVCRNVWSTDGGVTAHLRKLWGWDDVTMNLQMPKYKGIGMTEIVEWESNHGKNQHTQEVIKDWSKRDDHRHHAIDALVVACTRQGYIQRINTLNSSETKDEMHRKVAGSLVEFNQKHTLLNKYLITEKPFTTSEVEDVVSKILVSFKAGKKAATPGKRKVGKRGNKQVVQDGIIIPRGALHADSVSGSIKQYDPTGNFENHNVIKYKVGVGKGYLFDGKDDKKKIDKTIDCIVDKKIRDLIKQRAEESNYSLKKMFETPILFNQRAVFSVRCKTGNKAVVPIRNGYVVPDNNHHTAIYKYDGGLKEQCVSLMQAIERKRYNLPIIIKNPKEIYDKITEIANINQLLFDSLPKLDWEFVTTLQKNDMFILGMDYSATEEALADGNYRLLSEYLYKVQNISDGIYRLCHHTITKFDLSKANKPDKRFYNIQSLKAWNTLNPQKVKINILGQIERQ
ncbi:CRISPR-associated protein Csn1/Cas9 family [Mucinivorans hirudinis]|uniref:CRISPR-associated endonuclease Cas9 n=1 Tax=Mucinivorans hirudinis TaxID=1433126 RepID=A0A060RE66_9BACT|nr:CRISPR-associated protein Csn1/Cas9 family [Mucinivorans hirudinis]